MVEHLSSLWESPGVILRIVGAWERERKERGPLDPPLIILTFRLYTKKTEKEDTRFSHQHKTYLPKVESPK